MVVKGPLNKRHCVILHALCYLSEAQRKALLAKADPALIRCISECALNILRGNVTLSSREKKRLKPYVRLLRRLAEKRTSVTSRKRAIIQKGGFLPLLLAPILSAILTSVIN